MSKWLDARRCENCRFYEELEPGERGECRRHPPVVGTVVADNEGYAEWPSVYYLSNCGEFQKDGI